MSKEQPQKKFISLFHEGKLVAGKFHSWTANNVTLIDSNHKVRTFKISDVGGVRYADTLEGVTN